MLHRLTNSIRCFVDALGANVWVAIIVEEVRP